MKMISTLLVNAMGLGAAIHELDIFTVQDVAKAMLCAQANLASGDIGLERYITERAQDTPWQEVLEAAENETLGARQDGMRLCSGDFMNLYAYPALVYGIALGLCLAEDAPIGSTSGGAR